MMILFPMKKRLGEREIVIIVAAAAVIQEDIVFCLVFLLSRIPSS